jgi:hypothetical protein
MDKGRCNSFEKGKKKIHNTHGLYCRGMNRKVFPIISAIIIIKVEWHMFASHGKGQCTGPELPPHKNNLC